MKVTLRLILSLILVTTVVALGSSVWQARQEETRLKIELEKRVDFVADGLGDLLLPSLVSGQIDVSKRIIEKFSNREKLLGISIYDSTRHLIVASQNIESIIGDVSRSAVEPVLSDENKSYGRLIDLGKDKAHAYSVILNPEGPNTYVLTLFHQTQYIHDRVKRIWINAFWRLSLQILVISLTTLLIFYLNVMSPIRRTAEWVKKIRLGEDTDHEKPEPLLGPLAKEVSHMAKSLQMARRSAEEEARLRHASESVWTAERLKEFVRIKLDKRPLFVVSHREPYMHVKKGSAVEWIVPASGLVTAIEPVLKACGGTWIAQGAGNADKDTVDQNDKIRVPPDDPQYTLKRIWLSRGEEEGYYYGFSNEGLWPLCHIAHTRPTFRATDWFAYREVNKKFAESVLKELEGTSEPCVLIQDYHFALLPALIKAARPDARVALFWHIPWPNPESFGICPWHKEVLKGMLGADIIGFHTQFHCNNFIQTVDRFLESRIDYEHFTVTREAHTTSIKPFPISIADDAPKKPLQTDRAGLLKPYGIHAQYLGIGVDRLDYTKGIIERFRAVEYFLETNPIYQGKFTFIELGAPSRTLIPKYQEFMNEIEKEVERINEKFKVKNWQAILFLKKHHSHEEIAPFYRFSDVCLVTSLHDGMNLVAKEFVHAREDEKGVLVLSEFTGAARELKDALIVNPYDAIQTSEAIRAALEMSDQEQTKRMKRMRAGVKSRNIYKWAADLVGDLAEVSR